MVGVDGLGDASSLTSPSGEDFTVLDRIGSGSFADVFRVAKGSLDTDFAMKRWRTPLESDELNRFVTECRLQFALSDHPNIVRLHWCNASAGEPPWLVTELYDESLETRLLTGALEREQIMRVAGELLSGLAAIHARDHLHRDVKPGNVLLKGGHAALTDLGLALHLDGKTSANAAGTYPYVAPELGRGAAPSTRSDVFSAGVTIARLFREDLPPAIEKVLDFAQSHRPQDRPADAAQFREMLATAFSAAGWTTAARDHSSPPLADPPGPARLTRAVTSQGGITASMGTTDSVRCADCGASLALEARFCPGCGVRVTPADVAEVRKTVTLLVCDVTGSTALGERLDPEALRAVMSRYFEAARTVIQRHGGTVEKFVGDAVLGVFGIPEVREDDALRAVRAASQLTAELSRLADGLSETVGIRFSVRIGVNTGPVIAGADRAGGSFATGDAVNTAARLEQAAAPGSVLLAADTWSLVRDAVTVEALEPLTVKGKTEPMAAYRLLSVSDADRGRARRQTDILFGRDRAQQMLSGAVARVGADSDHLELITVLGDAGMGKTTLIEHVVAGLDDRVRVLSGRCVSYGTGITFWPIAQIVRQAAALTSDADIDKARAVLLSVLAGVVEAERIVEQLLALLGVAESGGRTRMFWAVRSLLEHLALETPLVLVLDDLHWADPMLLDLLDDIRAELRDIPLLMLVSARPELLEHRPEWGAGSGDATTITLESLNDAQTAALMTQTLGAGLPQDAVHAVYAWAGGNPLFVQELTAHLLEQGVLAAASDGWRVHGDLSNARMPLGVNALLAARLDRLPADERTFIGRMSVIGLEFTLDEARSAHGDEVDVEEMLRATQRRDILRRRRAPNGAVWTFRHVLVREAAYEALPKSARAEVHEHFAEHLGRSANSATDSGAETLAFVAHHLRQAVRLRGEISSTADVVAALTERAVTATIAAADQARDADNLDAAMELSEQAEALLSPLDPRRRDRLFELTDMQLYSAHVSRARATLERLAELIEIGGSAVEELDRVSLDTMTLAMRMSEGGDIDPLELHASASRMADLARRSGHDARLVAALGHGVINSEMFRVRWNAISCALDEIESIGRANDRLGVRLMRYEVLVYGSTPATEALAIILSARANPSTGTVEGVLLDAFAALLFAGNGRHDRARELIAKCEAQWDQLGTYLLTAHSLAVHTYICLQDPRRAIETLQTAIAFLEETGAAGYASTQLAVEAAQHLELHDDASAERALARAQAITSPHDLLSVIWTSACRAVLAARAGRHDDANRLCETALDAVDQTDDVWVQAMIRRQLAEVARQRSDSARERQLLQAARDLFRTKGFHALADEVALRLAS